MSKFEKHLEWASEVVSKWPKWKQDVLGKKSESEPDYVFTSESLYQMDDCKNEYDNLLTSIALTFAQGTPKTITKENINSAHAIIMNKVFNNSKDLKDNYDKFLQENP